MDAIELLANELIHDYDLTLDQAKETDLVASTISIFHFSQPKDGDDSLMVAIMTANMIADLAFKTAKRLGFSINIADQINSDIHDLFAMASICI